MADSVLVSDIDIGRTLSVHRYGPGDPTTHLASGKFVRATFTPSGPATICITWTGSNVTAEAWGPGGDWLLGRVPELVGLVDSPVGFDGPHQEVVDAQRNHPRLRISAGGGIYHSLLPTIIGQRVTSGEARRSWQRLVRRFGDEAPGPLAVMLPPAPEILAGLPYWALHRLGIEQKRARVLAAVARRAAQLHALEDATPPRVRTALADIPGVGPWTIGSVLGPTMGDPDAFAVGDFWLKHIVCRALAGEARGTDERMVELLAPYDGQRGRVVALLRADGWRAERRGSGHRVLPMADW